MKKYLLIVCCLAFTLGLNAQLRFGAKVGGTLSSLSQKTGNVTDNNTKPRFGFLIGGMAEYSFTEDFALQPELLYLLGGSKMSAREEVLIPIVGSISADTESTTTLHYIQLPVNLKYKFGIEGLKFYVTAGPYFSLIAGGNTSSTYTYNILGVAGTAGNEQDLFASDNQVLKRADVGLGVGFGIEIRKIMLGAGYNFGLTNIAKSTNSTTKTGTFNLSAGYFF